MLNLIETELTRVRRMAEQANDGFLLYLVDMAIIEAHNQARFHRDASDGLATPRSAAPRATQEAPGLRVVV